MIKPMICIPLGRFLSKLLRLTLVCHSSIIALGSTVPSTDVCNSMTERSIGHKPVGNEPVSHEPVGNEPVSHDPEGSEPVGHEPEGDDQDKSQRPRTSRRRTSRPRSKRQRTSRLRTNRQRTNRLRTNKQRIKIEVRHYAVAKIGLCSGFQVDPVNGCTWCLVSLLTCCA